VREEDLVREGTPVLVEACIMAMRQLTSQIRRFRASPRVSAERSLAEEAMDEDRKCAAVVLRALGKSNHAMRFYALSMSARVEREDDPRAFDHFVDELIRHRNALS